MSKAKNSAKNSDYNVHALLRADSGKSVARALRREGRIPAIIYGSGKEDIKLSVDQTEIERLYLTGHLSSEVLTLELGKEVLKVLPFDVQLHPVTDKILHVDFLRVDPKQKVRVNIPVRFTNVDKCPGIKRGGVLNVVRRSVALWCVPDTIPRAIEIDLSGYKIGQSIHLSHIQLPEGAESVITGRDFTIAAVAGRGAKADDDDAATPAAGDAAADAPAKQG